jgi:HK97 family phage prohead protease
MIKKILDKRSKNDYVRMAEIQAAEPVAADDGKMIVEGLAVVFDQPTVLFEYEDEYGQTVQIKEVIEKGALDNTDVRDCFFKYNHSNHVMAMARVKNGTLKLELRDDGLFIRAELADTTAGRDLYTLVKRGDIDKMSFAFNIEKEEYDQAEHMFRVQSISKLWDVAPVNVPAYEGTSIYARRLEDVEALRAQQVEALEAKKKEEKEKEREALRSKIGIKIKTSIGGK